MSTDRDPLKHYATLAAQAAAGEPSTHPALKVMQACADQLRADHLPHTAEMLDEVRASVAELFAVATSCKNAMAIIASAEDSDTSDMYYRLFFEDLPRLRAALARIGSTP